MRLDVIRWWTYLVLFLVSVAGLSSWGCSKSDSTKEKEATKSEDETTAIVLKATKREISFRNKTILDIECWTDKGKPCSEQDYQKNSNSYRIDKAHLQDQNPNSFLVEPLFKQCEFAVDETKSQQKVSDGAAPIVGTLLLDETTPYRILTRLLYTLSMCQISEMTLRLANDSTSLTHHISIPEMKMARAVDEHAVPALNLTLLILRDSIQMSVSRHHQERCERAGLLKPIFDGRDGTMNHRELYNATSAIKRLAASIPDLPNSGEIKIGAKGDVPFSRIESVMRTTRKMLPKESYKSDDTFNKATPTEKALFPSVVFFMTQ